ncbi:MAG: helix-hairpin-helix domain-containing protein [Candidatus Eisenbacteria bacterium]
MTSQERWLVILVAFLVLFGSAARRYRLAPAERSRPAPASIEPEAESPGEKKEEPEEDRIDLNRCDARELEELPGLGPVLARRVIDWREAHGPYGTVEDLVKVRGIGPKTLRRVRSRLVVTAGENRGGESGKP